MTADNDASALAALDRAMAAGRLQEVADLAEQLAAAPTLRRVALRRLVHAQLGLGALAAALDAADRLRRLEPPMACDLTLAGVVHLCRAEPEAAAPLLAAALDLDPYDALAARAVLKLGAPGLPHLNAAITALAWNADADPDALAALHGIVVAGLRPVLLYVSGGRICGVAATARLPDPDSGARLVWRGHVISASALAVSDPVVAFALDLPGELRDAPYRIEIGGLSGPGLPPFPRALLRPPRIATRVTRAGGDILIQALDRACAERPLPITVQVNDGPERRMVLRPPPSRHAPLIEDLEGARIPAQPPDAVIRIRHLSTGEPGGDLHLDPDALGRGKRPEVPPNRPIDIIVPVYGDREATRACLESLLAHPPGVPADIIVVDDDTPDPEIRSHLEELAAHGAITCLRNLANLGFVRSVNRGMGLHPDRDVVLLNSDTLVHGDWLARLRLAAYSDPDIGTVTPLSNDATILSYPARNAPTPLTDVDVAAMDDLAARSNAGVYEDIPTAVGFCMYIKRACLEQTGYFDADAFGTGYGEENDFCRRAVWHGWRNIATGDTYVGHVGGASFGHAKAARIESALRVLEQRHPGYHAEVHRFIAADPLNPMRRRMDIALLAAAGPRTHLLVCPKLGGGTDRYVDERIAELGVANVIQARPYCRDGRHRLAFHAPDRPELGSMDYDQASELSLILDDAAALGIARMELHHVMELTEAVLTEFAASWPYRIVVHDYTWICPRVNMVDESGRHCGDPDVSVCERCIQKNGHRLRPGLSVRAWRRTTAELFAGADTVVCSTTDTQGRMQRHVDANWLLHRPEVAIPPALRAPRPGPGVRVAVIGAIGLEKGFDVLADCAAHVVLQKLPFSFQVVGYTKDDQALLDTGIVTVTGRYTEGEAVELLRRLDCDVAFIPSVWPETWCYAMSIAQGAGLPVLAFDLGAQALRIAETGGGATVPLGSPPAVLLAALADLAGKPSAACPGAVVVQEGIDAEGRQAILA